ncbi:putative oxidoreductase YjmC [Saccoglossus kowalevskii]
MANHDESYRYVDLNEARSFIERCMQSVGTKPSHAAALAEVLVKADYRGHYSHGINRLDVYLDDIKKKTTVSDTEPSIVKENVATGYVDGCNLLGPVVGKFCMELAIKKAKEAGIGWVVANGMYVIMLGTNPITCAAPAKDGDSFVLDMATSAVALGKVEIADRAETSIPQGWGVDSTGQITTDSKSVLQGGGLLPLGGSEETSGYKGYGLAMMVEMFCGILGNGDFGPNIRRWKDADRVANLGQCFVAIDPESFAPGFTDRMQSLIDICRGQQPAEGESEVLIAGDPERIHMKKVDRDGGLRYHINLINALDKIAVELGVTKLKTL